jgi:hypothetical protein
MNQVQHQPVLENDAVSKLSLPAELFLHRLLNAVDRYGCFDARPAILRAKLFPLKLNDVTEAGISEWLAECVNVGLIKLYDVNGLHYLCVAGFKRKMGSTKTPYPEPPQQPLLPGTNFDEPNTHHTFLKDLYQRKNEQYLAAVCIRVRHPEIKPAWVQAFNEHLRTEHKHYTEGHEWLKHLKQWLPENIQRLRNEDGQVVSERRAFEAAA